MNIISFLIVFSVLILKVNNNFHLFVSCGGKFQMALYQSCRITKIPAAVALLYHPAALDSVHSAQHSPSITLVYVCVNPVTSNHLHVCA